MQVHIDTQKSCTSKTHCTYILICMKVYMKVIFYDNGRFYKVDITAII